MKLSITIMLLTAISAAANAVPPAERVDPYAAYRAGPSHSKAPGIAQGADFFPIAVWLQDAKYARRYKQAGINLYIHQWKGPTAKQLITLKAAGMPLICHMNEVALADIKNGDSIIVGWMHGDEPDNAKLYRHPTAPISGTWAGRKELPVDAWGDKLTSSQRKSVSAKKGKYGPPFSPSMMIADYKKIRAMDPTRPIMLNLGQGVAWADWNGRGVRKGKQEDYVDYVRGADIVSYDIYPIGHSHKAVAGKQEYVSLGVKNLRKWTRDKKPLWTFVECTQISNPDSRTKITPRQMRQLIWMSITAGSKGVLYFCHQFQPKPVNPKALLDDPAMLSMAAKVNTNIQSIAAVLNSSSVERVVTVTGGNDVLCMVKRYKNNYYVFLASESGKAHKITLQLKWVDPVGKLTPLFDENLAPIQPEDGKCMIKLEPYGVAQYKIPAPAVRVNTR